MVVSELFLSFFALIITGTLAMYGIAASFQIGHLVVDGLKVRSAPDVTKLAALWQTIGITLALCWFTTNDDQFMLFATLFIALRIILQPLSAPSWDRSVELPLLIMAIISLVVFVLLHSAAFMIY